MQHLLNTICMMDVMQKATLISGQGAHLPGKLHHQCQHRHDLQLLKRSDTLYPHIHCQGCTVT